MSTGAIRASYSNPQPGAETMGATMSDDTPTVRRALTHAEMTQIKEGIDTADTVINALVAALQTTFNALLSEHGLTWEDFSAERPLDGTKLQIPDHQWIEIANWLSDKSDENLDAVDRVNLALSWMNSGPSGYKTE